MTTLKEHELRLREHDPMTESGSRIVLSVIDILAHLNATTAPNNNDALLVNDLKACASQNASESARIKELENMLSMLYDENVQLRNELTEANRKFYEVEQAGCRKEDTQVQDGGWIEWKGGKCPLGHMTEVEVRYRKGKEESGWRAGAYYWNHTGLNCDIIAYRVVKP